MYTYFVVHNALEGECYGNKGLTLDEVLIMPSLKGLLPHIIIDTQFYFYLFSPWYLMDTCHRPKEGEIKLRLGILIFEMPYFGFFLVYLEATIGPVIRYLCLNFILFFNFSDPFKCIIIVLRVSFRHTKHFIFLRFLVHELNVSLDP